MSDDEGSNKLIVDELTKFMKENKIHAFKKSTEKWLTSHHVNQHYVSSLKKFMQSPDVYPFISNSSKLARAFAKLQVDPYTTVDIGERRMQLNNVMKFRDTVNNRFSFPINNESNNEVTPDSLHTSSTKKDITSFFKKTNNTLPKTASKQASICQKNATHKERTTRQGFLLSKIWKQRPNEVYLPKDYIQGEIHKCDIKVDGIWDHLEEHPEHQGMYTTKGHAHKQRLVAWIIDNASLLIDPPDLLEEAEDDDDDMYSDNSSSLYNTLNNYHDIGSLCADLDGVQSSAVSKALSLPVSIIFGGAGVGKTKTIGSLIKAVESTLINKFVYENGCPSDGKPSTCIICAAFTHKAAKCIDQRTTSFQYLKDKEYLIVSTIDSLIGKLENKTLPKTFYLILDEASMISLKLMARLGAALLSAGSIYQLCIVGDDGQLKPIERGEIFRYILSRIDTTLQTHLKICYRIEHMDLFDACNAIRNGELPQNSEHFEFLNCDDNHGITNELIKTIKELGDNAQYVAWRNEDVVNISNIVQKKLLKEGKINGEALEQDTYVKHGTTSTKVKVRYHVGDRVVFNGNKYKNVTRSSMGIVKEIIKNNNKPVGIRVLWDSEALPVDHRFDTNNAKIAKTQEEEEEDDSKMAFMLAYCITVHKSQGSEFENVVVVCYDINKQSYLDDRRWLYTAVSRGKERVKVIGNRKQVANFLSAPVKEMSIMDIKI